MGFEKLKKNTLFQETDVPAWLRISESETWTRVLFWYIIFIAFATICGISVYSQFTEYMNNPMNTDVVIKRSNGLQLPNVSLCISGTLFHCVCVCVFIWISNKHIY
jgi:hypothetical protein